MRFASKIKRLLSNYCAQKPESSSLPCTLRKCKNECRGSNNCYIWTPDDYKQLGCKINKLEQQQQQQQLLGRKQLQMRQPRKSRTLGDTSMQIFAVTDVDGNTVFASKAAKSGEHNVDGDDNIHNGDNVAAANLADGRDDVVDNADYDDDADADNGYGDNELLLLMSAGGPQAANSSAAPSTSHHPLACTTYSQTSPVQFHDDVQPIEQPIMIDSDNRTASQSTPATALGAELDVVVVASTECSARNK